MKITRRIIDQLLGWIFGGDGSEEPTYYRRRQRIKKKDDILYEMSSIDSKSSALLTHVSIMLAVVTVLITEVHGFWKVVLTIDLLAFSVGAMLLLRCVDVMGPPYRMPPRHSEGTTKLYYNEIRLRRGIYQSIVRMVFVLTFLLVVIMILKMIITMS